MHNMFFVPGDLDLDLTFDIDIQSHPSAVNASIRFSMLHQLCNASPKKDGVSPISGDFAPKIGCHGNVP